MSFDTKWHLLGASSDPLLKICLLNLYYRHEIIMKIVWKRVSLLKENINLVTGNLIWRRGREACDCIWHSSCPLCYVRLWGTRFNSSVKNSSLENKPESMLT